ncbi:MAG: hypothetical protein DMG58_10130 [Acidobacteria bacterium]|nr:MAG: hypothetical protein DMG58_10130 [Acidobacteriota bacterium]
MLTAKIWPSPGLESATDSSKLARRVERNSYASTYMEINLTLNRTRLSLVRMDGNSKKRGH